MKHTELEDGDQLVTRLELREVLISIHEDILELKTEVIAIKAQINDIREIIRTKWWIPVAVAVATMIGTTAASICAAIILRHH